MDRDAQGAIRVTFPGQIRGGSVTERLSARVTDLEAVVQRMLENEAKLIADSIAQEARIKFLHEHIVGIYETLGSLDERLKDLPTRPICPNCHLALENSDDDHCEHCGVFSRNSC